MSNKSTKRTGIVLFITLLTLFTIGFVYFYLKGEQPVWQEDYHLYHLTLLRYAEVFEANPLAWLHQTLVAVYSEQKNPVITFLLYPFYVLGGSSRLAYLLGIHLMYLIPTILLVFLLVKYHLKEENKLSTPFLIFMGLTTSFYAPFWMTTIKGRPDIACLIPYIYIMYAFCKYKFEEKINPKILILCTLGLYLPFLLRRWCLISTFSILTGILVTVLIRVFLEEKKLKVILGKIKTLSLNLLWLGGGVLLFALLIQKQLFLGIFDPSYHSLFNAYKFPMSLSIKLYIYTSGIITLIVCSIGAILSIKNKNTRYTSVFYLINILLYFYIFTRVQIICENHRLLIELWTLLLFIFGSFEIYKRIKNKSASNAFLIILSLYYLTNFSNIFFPKFEKFPLFSGVKWQQEYHPYFSEISRLTEDLKKLIKKDEDCKIATFSRSKALCYEFLVGSDQNRVYRKNIIPVPVMDLENKNISPSSLLTDYVVVTDPVQITFSEDISKIITIPTEMIIKNKQIGKAYTRLPGKYQLGENIYAYIYKRERPLTKQELNSFDKLFLAPVQNQK